MNEIKIAPPIILDGRPLRDQGALRLKELISVAVVKPTLAILQVGNLPESCAYIEKKGKFAEMIGARVIHVQFPDTVSEDTLVDAIDGLNRDVEVQGIIVQLPIPDQLNKQKILDTISIAKDTDGLTSGNKELFEVGDPRAVVPATARGVLSLLTGYGISIRGKKATVIGRSALVGAPIATLLRREGALVTVCHSKTENVPEKSRQSDILIVAIGRPNFVNKEYVTPDQTVIDVGINSTEGVKLDEEIPKRKLVGDVDFEAVNGVVGAISPVPGGVGPMTVLSLFENLIDACKLSL
ncbi:MAG: bifunctional 5,10-methylenetetrahydrofolate dehydrogenase/5,10-methenyltetrahydrofolate cyclohydrolase [Patescibacteria group bacterium]